MATFAEFIDRLVEDIDNRNSRTEPKLKEYTIKCLRQCDVIDFVPMEATFTFNTVAGQEEYTGSVSGFPAGAKDIAYMQLDYPQPTGGVPLREIDFSLLRESYYSTLASSPRVYAWVENTMYLAPVPSEARALSGSYYRSATRDVTSGDLITESSGTQTNPWLNEGELYLQALVLNMYYLSIGNDREQASSWQILGAVERERIDNEWVRKHPAVLPDRADNYTFDRWVDEYTLRRGY